MIPTPVRPFAVLCVLAPTFAQSAAEDPRDGNESAARRAAQASNRFGLELYRRVAATQGNLFFSPYSISAALAMARTGARGATAEQMDAVLRTKGLDVLEDHPKLAGLLRSERFESDATGRRRPRPSHRLRIANALWGRQGIGFEAEFLSGLEQKFGAPLQRVDFARPEVARRRINDWVAKQTEQRIKDLVPQGLPEPDTLLVLGNAIHFQAAWREEFVPGNTKPHRFTNRTGVLQTPMMRRVDYLDFVATDAAKLVSIQLDGGETAMVVVLPERRDGLLAVEKGLTAEVFAAWRGRMRARYVSLMLPKFRFDAALDLAKNLRDMGMSDPFDPRRADFTGMTRQDPPFIAAVLHKAFVDVHEKGVEAAAATAEIMGPTAEARPPEPVGFVADHPFLFFIVHLRTSCILFAGRVEVPTAAQ